MSTAELETNAAQGAGNKRKLTIARALNEAMHEAMSEDTSVVVMGEDVAKIGGIWGTFPGLLDNYGAERVRDTPISESGFIGAAVGMAATGLRPVVELMFVDFFGVCMDAIYNLAAKQSYFSGGQVKCPMVLMTAVGGGYCDAGQHSQCLYATFGHLPGMKVVIPSNAYDAKGMLHSAILDDSPVVFMFHKALQGVGWLGTTPGSIVEVPQTSYTVPLDKVAIAREGSDVTLVGLGATVHHALDAATELEKEGISCEVVDLRAISPLDREGIRTSVRKTGRLIAIDDDYLSYGVAGEVIASVCEDAGVSLKAPPRRIAHPDVPVPFSRVFEEHALPNADVVATEVRNLIRSSHGR